jgi:GT2 family glycosyltransferase
LSPRRPLASIVVVAHNEGELLRQTVGALRATAPQAQLIVVDDCSEDGSSEFLRSREWTGTALLRSAGRRLGVAAARNLGARSATGSILVFSDAHVVPRKGWLPELKRALSDPSAGISAPAVTNLPSAGDALGYGFTWTEPTLKAQWLLARPSAVSDVPFVSGCFMATPRRVFEALGGFDEGFSGWGHEDAEYSMRVWLSGYRCVVAPRAEIAHRFQTTFTYDVDPAAVLHNRMRIGVLHLSPRPLRALLRTARADPVFPEAFRRLMAGDIWRRRDQVRALRRRSDEWFLDSFAIHALD